MKKDEAIHAVLCFLWERCGQALDPNEQSMFIITIAAIVGDAIEYEAYQAIRRRLDYCQTFSHN